MKVILTHEVSGLGTAGDVVDVKPGYARNFLYRRGLAEQWTKGAQKQVEALAAGRAARAGKSLEEATSIKGNLESKSVTISAHAGESGRLFGAVTSREVAEAVHGLERQYDVHLRGIERPSLLAGEDDKLPSADELGAEFEDFLRTVDDGDS